MSSTPLVRQSADLALNGFQPFVKQSLIAVPFTTIVGRAQIPDLANDLGARMGVDRLMTQQAYPLQNEFGPNGEPVLSVFNDSLGLVRFVGTWISQLDTEGLYLQSGNNTTDYVEVTFYGTGLNVLGEINTSAKSVFATIDGGTEGGNILPNSGVASSTITGRFNAVNNAFPAASGLSPGIHTIKLRYGTSGRNYGFEVLNESSLVKVNPGVGYAGNQRLSLASQQSVAYNAAVTGIRGGRVLTYLNSSGVVAQAFQAVNASQGNMALADHTNEEVARVYHWREFGINRSEDFSTVVTGGGVNRAHTLDDGTTSLVGSSIAKAPQVSVVDAGQMTSAGAFFVLTFVGTGLDLISYGDVGAVSDSHSFVIDGVTLGSLTTTSVANQRYFTKVVSGLPYGTHTFKLLRNAAASGSAFNPYQFIVYQPKKPTLPAGAVELCDYNVMANYVFDTTSYYQGSNRVAMSQGVLFKSAVHELIYTGAWNNPFSPLADGNQYSYGVQGTTTSSAVRFTFFGTGFEALWTFGAATAGVIINIDGSNYTGAATASTGGGSTVSWTPGTSTFAATGGQGGSISVNTLALGTHTVIMTLTGNVTNTYLGGITLITPIHSHKSNLYADGQNTLPVGSQGISDSRKLSPTKEIPVANKYRATAAGQVSTPTTTSTSDTPIPDMSLMVPSRGGWFAFSWSISLQNNGANETNVRLYVDGTPDGTFDLVTVSTSQSVNAMVKLVYLTPGVHKADLYWHVGAGTASAIGTRRIFSVQEL